MNPVVHSTIRLAFVPRAIRWHAQARWRVRRKAHAVQRQSMFPMLGRQVSNISLLTSNYGCLSDSTGFYWFSTDQCVWAVPPTVQFIYQTSAFGGDWGTLTATGGGQTAINALGIGIRYKQSDLAPKTSTSSPSTTTSRASESATTPPWQIHSSGLAAGAKAGIAVGAVVAALIVLGLLLFCVRRRRKARAANHMTGDGNQSADDYQRRGPDNVGQYRDLHSPSSKAELESPLPDLSERESYMQPTARGRAQLYNQQSPTELA